jgi:hypothetical protein
MSDTKVLTKTKQTVPMGTAARRLSAWREDDGFIIEESTKYAEERKYDRVRIFMYQEIVKSDPTTRSS